jgi:CopA family copper-resistance protein
MIRPLSRRALMRAASAAGLAAGIDGLLPGWAKSARAVEALAATEPNVFDLVIGAAPWDIDGKSGKATVLNGTVPGPLVRFREGEDVTIRVRNDLAVDTSVHWHGVLVPADMDGVPDVSYPGIKPGETFTYRYRLKQSGTYWYHSHTGFQEQTGLYGPMIIDPAGEDPVGYDREYVVQLADWTFDDPMAVFKRLKRHSDYYNRQHRTMEDFFRDVSEKGLDATLKDREAWAGMRMDPTDIQDVTGATYSYLLNGRGPASNWIGLFKPGERVRLRFINSSSMTYFNVRIPGLAMTVVQADGQDVQPVAVDEFQIAVAETYDVIVTPEDDKAFTIFAESMDRSGYACGTLAPRPGMSAEIPPLRPRPLLTMADMGMSHTDMGGMDMSGSADGMKMDHGTMDHGSMDHMSHMDHAMAPAPIPVERADKIGGPGVDMRAPSPQNRLAEPGLGLTDVGHKVLVYTDLKSLAPLPDPRPPARELELHLTGNMERYMWSFDGRKYSEVTGPILFRTGERLRLTLVNDTMMNHPIHLHGMFMDLDTGAGAHNPRKHTINVLPGSKLSADITADAPGDWAFHCHFLYHMMAGMFRVVRVSGDAGARS